ncbi:MAG TPA: NADH-quinone oxidoreductase subunit N [Chloroflexota bacterium]|nr:NADH-quinone oxidoreductase subunit N [Chloroflexota bacterium]
MSNAQPVGVAVVVDAQDLMLLAPEIILVIGAFLVVLLDLVLPAGRSRRPLAYLALVAVIVAAVAALGLLGVNRPIFFGTVVVDTFGTVFKLLFLGATALVLLSSGLYAERLQRWEAEYYAMLLFGTVGLMLLAASAEFITLVLALELSSLANAFLVCWSKNNLKSTEAALKYFLIGVLSSAVLLYGIAFLYGLTGVTTLAGVAGLLRETPTPAVMLAVAMVVAGFGFKISAVPFQMWTPDVYEGAPTTITAYLSVASKAAGFAVVLRVFDLTFGTIEGTWTTVFAVLAVLTMTLGNLLAMVQSNIKRMLAYSSIAQAGYALVGVVAATQQGTAAVIFFMAAYLFTQLGAFLAVVSDVRFAPDDTIEGYSGLHFRAPLLAATLAVSLLSLGGLPPFAGFFSKLYLFWAAINRAPAEGGPLYWLVLIGVVNSAVSLYYYARIIRQMYLVPPTSDKPVAIPAAHALALALCVVGMLVLGPFAGPFIGLAQTAAATLVR